MLRRPKLVLERQRPKVVRSTAAAALVPALLAAGTGYPAQAGSGAGHATSASAIRVPAMSAPARRAPALNPRSAAACAQLGSYHIGPQITPFRSAHVRPPVAAGQTSLVWPATTLQGTLTLSAYAACGHPTAGSFAVRRVPLGPIPQQQGASGPYGITAVSGSFKQDAAHPADPLYVTVSATITATQPGPALMRPCAQKINCPTRAVMTSTVAMADVTGYLQFYASGILLSPTDGPPAGQRLSLSFLPPPSAFAGADPSALVLHAWRGNAMPVP